MTTEPQQSATQRGGIPADSFANRLMLARAYAGHLSIREAADLCGIGRGAWTNWEKGARPADIIEITAVIADKLSVDRNWLLFGGQLGPADPRGGRRPAGGPPNKRSTQGAARIAPTDRRDEPRRPRLISSRPADHRGPTTSPMRNRPRDTRPAKRPRAA